ncbi:MAG: PhzF family phenazine biosynthesis protein, partial [Anaerolineales bacterium]
MRIHQFLQVDAFTDQPLYGNPCAVLFETDNIEEDKLLAIAKEMNLSETAFVRHSDIADFAVRYFTPAEEIPLAGHPTIATAHALVDTGRVKLIDTLSSIKLEMRVGIIQVDIHSREGEPRVYTMRQQTPKFLSIYDPEEVMPIFGLSVGDLLQNNYIQTVSTGTPQLMIPVQGLDVLRRIEININAYADLRTRGDFF